MRYPFLLSPLFALLVQCAAPARPAPAGALAAPASGPAPALRDAGPTPRLAEIPIPGPAPFAAIARDVLDVAVTIDPSVAASAGLFDDAARVPSYAPARVAALTERLDRDLAALRALPWRTYAIDAQVDHRWLVANVETMRRVLVDERLHEHRPAQWLELLSNALIALVSYAPERTDLQRRIFAEVPVMVEEMRAVATRVTRRDVETGVKLAEALGAMAKATRSAEGNAAAAALGAYASELAAGRPATEYVVVGAESYAWRYRHAMLLPWTPDELLHEAQSALSAVDAEMAALKPRLTKPGAPTASELETARTLTRDGLLGLYDGIETSLRAATIRGGWVTVPAWVGPVRARETPEAMVPLTGDGGSMNPPPTFVASNVGYWNVEHFRPDASLEERLATVRAAQGFLSNGMGPYAAHEGFPGHHLQLAIARLNADPLRSVLSDPVLQEGWALYAEDALASHGGLGDSADARQALLRSYRHRIARVIFDVNIERGAWDLQRGADFRQNAAPGKGQIDEDVLRSIQWPTQLVCYFAGKLEIVRLRDEMKRRAEAKGEKLDERAFHDALLAEGSIPVALVRAKMLGEPIPE